MISCRVIRALFTPRRIVVAAVAGVAFTLTPAPAPAQECLDWVRDKLNTSTNCLSVPSIERSLAVATFHWKGQEYLVSNMGNELWIWNIGLANAQDPQLRAISSFEVGNVGDSDHDLLNFSVCNDCRYGVANYKAGTVLFDLGIAAVPDFAAARLYTSAPEDGGLTFRHSSRQYLVSNKLPNRCTDVATVYTFDGIDFNATPVSDLIKVGCAAAPGIRWLNVVNGAYVDGGAGNGYLYMAASDSNGYTFEVTGSGTSISLTYMAGNMVARSDPDLRTSFDVDGNGRWASGADRDQVYIYDLGTPDLPELVGTIPLSGIAPRTAISFPLLSYGQAYTYRPYLADITDPQNILADVDPGFWDLPWAWNTGDCTDHTGAAFATDGATMYHARFARLQVIDTAECATIQPLAGISLGSASSFPGDTATVADSSAGRVESWALWVSGSADPGAAPVAVCGAGDEVCGSRSFAAAAPDTLQVMIGQAVQAGVEYWAHAAVAGTGYPNCTFPINETACGAQYTRRELVIDRTPTVTIGLGITTAVIGDEVTATVLAEGAPGNPGGDTFEWIIAPPAPAPTQPATGAEIGPVALVDQGTWYFDLTAHYEHEASVGVLYDAAAPTAMVEVTSVVADLSVSATDVCPEIAITFDAAGSRPTEGNLSFAWTITGPTPYTSCTDAATCVIPGDSLDPGTYDVEVVVTNDDTGDSDPATASFVIRDCSVDLDFTWSPVVPEIGESVLFEILGVSGELASATWDFGGPGCVDHEQITTCDPGVFSDCMSQVYEYATSGTRTVMLTIWVGDRQYQASRTLSVLSTGSCDAGGGTGCPLALLDWPAVGGEGILPVLTAEGCAWSASAGDSWITITGASPGNGSGAVSYQVAANPGCEWFATANDSWITVTGGLAGSDAGELHYQVSQSQCRARIGSLVVSTADGEQSYVIAQAGASLGAVYCDDFETGDLSGWSEAVP